MAYEADVVSAHRMPEEMLAYGKEAAGRGLQVIIAGAGGAAHLPGMLAAVTPLPVIGVPVPLKHLDGLDSLLSIVQMPAGVPVATVGGRQRPQRRPARRAHPGRAATTRCASAWWSSRRSCGAARRPRARRALGGSGRPRPASAHDADRGVGQAREDLRTPAWSGNLLWTTSPSTCR